VRVCAGAPGNWRGSQVRLPGIDPLTDFSKVARDEMRLFKCR